MTLSEALLKWFDISKRKLPFRDINNPYKIWVSEIMLQQTKVNTMIPYYNNWITKFPNISSVAKSTQDEVLKYWEGLGYYSRCRNFYNAAKIVCDTKSDRIAAIIKLKAFRGKSFLPVKMHNLLIREYINYQSI